MVRKCFEVVLEWMGPERDGVSPIRQRITPIREWMEVIREWLVWVCEHEIGRAHV